MSTLNETPSSNRLHIGIYGKTNSGKSSLINALTNQNVSIVADVAGTTTDPVYKPMEINPLGPCVIIDTAGFDDDSQLGARRIEKTRLAAEKTDIAVVVLDAGEVYEACKKETNTFESAFPNESSWIESFKKKNTPILVGLNKVDLFHNQSNPDVDIDATNNTAGDCATTDSGVENNAETNSATTDSNPENYVDTDCSTIVGDVDNNVATNNTTDNPLQEICLNWLSKELHPGISKNIASLEIVSVSASERIGIDKVKSALTRLMPEDFGHEFILGDLVDDGDLVLLVMPQDIQAPKGRLILPQVQTLRELLDRKCLVMSVTTDKLVDSLSVMTNAPKLIVTDSQVFGYVYENKPKESMLTSFSVLFAAYKGDLPYYVESAKAIDSLTENSKVLIAECCTHAPLAEDIGRVKLPRMLKKRAGDGLVVDIVSGTDFPQDVSDYDLVIQCGACMFNRKYVLSRIDRARMQSVPMTNYGVTIAHLTGILDQVSMP